MLPKILTTVSVLLVLTCVRADSKPDLDLDDSLDLATGKSFHYHGIRDYIYNICSYGRCNDFNYIWNFLYRRPMYYYRRLQPIFAIRGLKYTPYYSALSAYRNAIFSWISRATLYLCNMDDFSAFRSSHLLFTRRICSYNFINKIKYYNHHIPIYGMLF
ncbi:uncharacterized protein LOC122265241 [Penaeus japonicus]|uniref:uncharacterized protein LOC122265241 n=1 Tax=Penaeus japonicus TaxID=27405 RepID=UPI001C714F10|nr:uncharacterized protein LOC122265241 [Penaeus japonicus]